MNLTPIRFTPMLLLLLLESKFLRKMKELRKLTHKGRDGKHFKQEKI